MIETLHLARQSRNLGYGGSRPFDQANVFRESVCKAAMDWCAKTVFMLKKAMAAA